MQPTSWNNENEPPFAIPVSPDIPEQQPVRALSAYRTPVISRELISELRSKNEALTDYSRELETLKLRADEVNAQLTAVRQQWDIAGQPEVSENDVESTRFRLEAARKSYRKKTAPLFALRIRHNYYRSAKRVRSWTEAYDAPWIILATLSGATFFALGLVVGILVSKILVNALLFGAAGFVGGFVLLPLLLFVPAELKINARMSSNERTIRQIVNEQAIAKKHMDQSKSRFERAISQYRLKSDLTSLLSEIAENERRRSVLIDLEQKCTHDIDELKKRLSLRNELLKIDWLALRGTCFEHFLKDVFEQLGYSVQTTRTTGDQGVDLILTRDILKIAVQAKGYPSQNTIGNDAVQAVVAGMNHYGCSSCVVITNSTFTRAAIELAQSNNCLLIDQTGIERLINGRIM
jgi:restriction system protein